MDTTEDRQTAPGAARISVVVPVYNEEETIPELHRRLKAVLEGDFGDFEHEILFVDDGSKDRSFEKLEELSKVDPNIKILQFSRNFGHHIAVTAGMDHTDGDFVVMMDGDLQDQPEEIVKLYEKLNEGHDIVYAVRQSKKFSWLKRKLSDAFNFMIKRLINEDIVINSTIFRIMTREVVNSIRQLREQNRYVIGIIGWVGFDHAFQNVEHGARYGGQTKYSLSRQVALAMNAVFSFSDYFLKLITKVGLLFVALSVLMVGYALVRKLIFATPVTGWTSLIISVFLMGGIQIIILGVIGEYLGRTYVEVKRRPLYIIRKRLP